MPEECVDKSCLVCGWHVIVGKKLDCNYMNRLGLSKPTVDTFIDTEPDEDKLKRQAELSKKRMEDAQDELKKLQELKGKTEGKT